MKILFVSYNFWPPQFGGGLLHTIERLSCLANRGHSVIACTSGALGYKNKDLVNNLFVKRSTYKSKNNLLQKTFHHLDFFFWVAYQLIIQEYDVVHIGSLPGNNVITSSICGLFFSFLVHLRRARTVYLYSLAETESASIVTVGLSGRLRKLFLQSVDHLVVNSPGLFNEMQALFSPSLKLIINGVMDETFQPKIDERHMMRKKLQILEDEIIFTFLGTICKRKGVDTILEAYKSLSSKNKKVRLWLIGPLSKDENQNIGKSEEFDFQKFAEGNNTIKFWGRVDDRKELERLLNASDVFVFPTRREGMPMAPLQAMSCGLPIIISRIPGITDLANIEGETGLFIESGNHEELKDAMFRLAVDVQLRQNMGHNARQRIENHFSWQQHVDRWEHLYLGRLND